MIHKGQNELSWEHPLKEVESLRAQVDDLELKLALFNDAKAHCKDSKRSTTSSEGWTMIDSSYYKDLLEAQEQVAKLVQALDKQMVTTHLGVFNADDDPDAAIHKLMCWSQDVGEYFAKETIAKLTEELAAIHKEAETNQKWAFLEWRQKAEDLEKEQNEWKSVWENEYRLRTKAQKEVSRLTEELDQASSTCVMYKQQVLDLRDRISELSLELEQKDRRIKEMGGILISMAMESTE